MRLSIIYDQSQNIANIWFIQVKWENTPFFKFRGDWYKKIPQHDFGVIVLADLIKQQQNKYILQEQRYILLIHDAVIFSKPTIRWLLYLIAVYVFV